MTPRSVANGVVLVFTMLNAFSNDVNVAVLHSPPPPFKVPKLRSSRQLGDDEDPNRVVINVVLFIIMLNAFGNGIGGCCDVATTPPLL